MAQLQVSKHWAELEIIEDKPSKPLRKPTLLERLEGLEPLRNYENIADKTDDELLNKRLLKPLSYRLLSRITGLESEFCKEHFKSILIIPIQQIFQDVESYFTNGLQYFTNGVGTYYKLRITNLFGIQRRHEHIFEEAADNVKLLWHGTQSENLGSILSLGFCTPDRANRQLFGGGVYFADRVAKTVRYCKPRPGVIGSKRYLLLCSVNLGKMYVAPSILRDSTSPPAGYDSVMAPGKFIPDPAGERIFKQRVKVPCGKTIICKTAPATSVATAGPSTNGAGRAALTNGHSAYGTERNVPRTNGTAATRGGMSVSVAGPSRAGNSSKSATDWATLLKEERQKSHLKYLKHKEDLLKQQNPLQLPPEVQKPKPTHPKLPYNEYIVYDIERINIHFVVEYEFKTVQGTNPFPIPSKRSSV